MVDFYLKIDGSPGYNDKELEVSDDALVFSQMLEMMFTTKPGEVLGDPFFGLGLEKYLWNMNVGSNAIRDDIYQHIARYAGPISNRVNFRIDVNFIRGEITDAIIIDAFIEESKVLGVIVRP